MKPIVKVLILTEIVICFLPLSLLAAYITLLTVPVYIGTIAHGGHVSLDGMFRYFGFIGVVLSGFVLPTVITVKLLDKPLKSIAYNLALFSACFFFLMYINFGNPESFEFLFSKDNSKIVYSLTLLATAHLLGILLNYLRKDNSNQSFKRDYLR